MAVVRNYKYSSGADTSKVGVLEGVHRVQAHSHCGDDHKHHAGEIVDSSDRLYPVGNIHFVFV